MKKSWTFARWIFLLALVVAILLMISKPRNPAPAVPAVSHQQLSTQFEKKLEHLEQAKSSGETGTTEQFDAEEVNAGLNDMTENAKKAAGGTDGEPDVRVVGVNFVGNEVVGQFIVNRYGKDVYVTMAGRLGAKDGYANIELTSAQIGKLSVPVSLINPRLQQRLAEPAQRERLKLPDFISDLRVENGKLLVIQK